MASSPPPRRTRPARRLLGPLAVAVAALIAGVALIGVALAGSPSDERARTGPPPPRAERAASLRPFGSCAQLAGYSRRHRDSLDQPIPITEDTRAMAPDAAAGGELAAAEPAASSATNVQERGVDEPDLVKSDGSHVFAIAGRRLQAVEAAGPALAGSLVLPSGPGRAHYGAEHELLLAGDRALVISTSYISRAPWTRTVLTEVDVSDPAAMRAVRTMTVDGAYVNARLTGGTARVVTSSAPDPETGPPVPMARLRDRVAGTVARSPLVACDDVSRPGRFSGLGMLSVLTIDLREGLEPIDTDAVMTAGQVVYGSEQSLYVATERWLDPGAGEPGRSQVESEIHRFDVTDRRSTEYRATGRVPGFMLSQWSMSEHEGLLRVAATTAPPWLAGQGTSASESFVTVLGERDGRLVEVGRVDGLGRGEQIYAVRFIGDVGYVVTFRQVDPLYVIDLSDPARPRTAGELKIPGYSAYLHPVGAGTLLGVGQDATGTGSLLGAQLSLFDVSDLTRPQRTDRRSLGPGSYTEVEYDHHAFMWWEPAGLAVVPVQDGGYRPGFVGAAAFRVDADAGIKRAGRLSHGNGWRAAIRRSLVIGDRLFTYSDRGVMAHDLDTLADLGWAQFERGPES
jgi:uncharacterized secreted protein with C-terminal beta-propeller domain